MNRSFLDCARRLGLTRSPTTLAFGRRRTGLSHRAALDEAIAAQIAPHTVSACLEILAKAGISCGRVNSVGAAFDLPVIRERMLFVTDDTASDVAPLPQLRLPIDSKGIGPRTAPPKLGADGPEILKKVL